MLFYPFRNSTDTAFFVVIEAETHDDAVEIADAKGIDTKPSDDNDNTPNWADMMVSIGDVEPKVLNDAIASMVLGVYEPTGLAHGQVIYDNGEIMIY